MKRFFILFLSFLNVLFIVSQNVINKTNSFFETRKHEPSSILVTDTICYSVYYFDCHFPEYGSVHVPKTNFKITYDTISHYLVVLSGNIKLKPNKNRYKTEDIEYSELNSVSIWKLTQPRKQWIITKKDMFIESPIPYCYLTKIKEDFFFTVENEIIDVEKTDCNSNTFPVKKCYKLY